MNTDSDLNKYILEREGRLLANARQLMLSCMLLFVSAPVSAVILHRFFEYIPKMYFIIFLGVIMAALAGCMILACLAMWNFPSAGGSFQTVVKRAEHSNHVRANLLKSAFIVFFSAVGLFVTGVIVSAVLYLIFM